MAKIPGANYQSQVQYQTPAPPNLDFGGQAQAIQARNQERQSLNQNIVNVSQQAGDMFGRLFNAIAERRRSVEVWQYQQNLKENLDGFIRQYTDESFAYQEDPETGQMMYQIAPSRLQMLSRQYFQDYDGPLSSPLAKQMAEQVTEEMMHQTEVELFDRVSAMDLQVTRHTATENYQKIIERGDPQALEMFMLDMKKNGIFDPIQWDTMAEEGFRAIALNNFAMQAQEIATNRFNWEEVQADLSQLSGSRAAQTEIAQTLDNLMAQRDQATSEEEIELIDRQIADAEERLDEARGFTQFINPLTMEQGNLTYDEISPILKKIEEDWEDWRQTVQTEADVMAGRLYREGRLTFEWIRNNEALRDYKGLNQNRPQYWYDRLMEDIESRERDRANENEHFNEDFRALFERHRWNNQITADNLKRFVQDHKLQYNLSLEEVEYYMGIADDRDRRVVTPAITEGFNMIESFFDSRIDQAESKGDSDLAASLRAQKASAMDAYNQALYREVFNETSTQRSREARADWYRQVPQNIIDSYNEDSEANRLWRNVSGDPRALRGQTRRETRMFNPMPLSETEQWLRLLEDANGENPGRTGGGAGVSRRYATKLQEMKVALTDLFVEETGIEPSPEHVRINNDSFTLFFVPNDESSGEHTTETAFGAGQLYRYAMPDGAEAPVLMVHRIDENGDSAWDEVARDMPFAPARIRAQLSPEQEALRNSLLNSANPDVDMSLDRGTPSTMPGAGGMENTERMPGLMF